MPKNSTCASSLLPTRRQRWVPLCLLANRDEYYARPALALDFWPDYPQVLGGRDLQAGGSWMAIDTRGRFAAITHIREGRAIQAARSRGELVQRFVSGDEDPLAFAAWLKDNAANYGPFNLIFGPAGDLLHFNSRSAGAESHCAGHPRAVERRHGHPLVQERAVAQPSWPR